MLSRKGFLEGHLGFEGLRFRVSGFRVSGFRVLGVSGFRGFGV